MVNFLRSNKGAADSVIVVLQVEFIRAAEIVGGPTGLVIDASAKVIRLPLAIEEGGFLLVAAREPTEGVPEGRYRHDSPPG
jgi:hypothetical protein